MDEEKTEGKRQWQSGEVSTIEAITPLGEDRTYTFKVLNAEFGTKIFHEHVIIIIRSWEKLEEIVKSLKDNVKVDGDSGEIEFLLSNAKDVITLLPELFPWDNVRILSALLLSDHVMECEEGKFTADVTGFSDYTGDPLETYTALFYSLLANFPKYFGPLSRGILEKVASVLGTVQNPSSAEEANEEQKNEEKQNTR